MAEGDGSIYNNFKEVIMNGVYNLASAQDTVKVILVSGHTPNIDAAHSVLLNVSADEYGAGSGYTVGGETLAGQSTSQDDTNDRGAFDGTDLTWTALGALTPATPSHTIMYDDTPTTPQADPLIAYWTLGTTATNGGDYTLQWGTNGIILLT
jgi:hypothetical protein